MKAKETTQIYKRTRKIEIKTLTVGQFFFQQRAASEKMPNQ